MTTAEILITASRNVGKPMRFHWGWSSMDIADAIADVCPKNGAGACDAFRVLHEASGAVDLRAWQSGQDNYQIAAFMRETARRIAN